MTVAYVVDTSNYTRTPLDGVLEQWKALGVVAVMVQAVNPPKNYPTTLTRPQIQACLDHDMPVGWYAFWWYGVGTDYLKRQMDLLDGFDGKLLCPAGDWEDTTIQGMSSLASGTRTKDLPAEHVVRLLRQGHPEQKATLSAKPVVSLQQLLDDMFAWEEVMRTFPTRRQVFVDYSGSWYINGYLHGTTSFARPDHLWWTAQYDGIEDPATVIPWGGYRSPAALKQFAGSTKLASVGGIDLSVASEEFMALLNDTPAPSPTGHTVADLESVIGDLTGPDGEIIQALQQLQLQQRDVQDKTTALLTRLAAVHSEILGS